MIHVLIFLSLFLFHDGSAIYFHMKDTDAKCFYEEVPEDTIVAGNFRVEELVNEKAWHLADEGIHVDITDPSDEVVHSKLYSSQGVFSFTAHTPGDYKICLSSNSTAWFGGQMMRVHLDIGVGDHAQNYADIAAKEKLSDLELRLRQLIDQVEMIIKEQDFQRNREEFFRHVSDKTNSRVSWWSVIQVVILVAIGFWQMRNLRSFFQAKKLV